MDKIEEIVEKLKELLLPEFIFMYIQVRADKSGTTQLFIYADLTRDITGSEFLVKAEIIGEAMDMYRIHRYSIINKDDRYHVKVGHTVNHNLN